jgi:uncharacterized protein YcaQ
LQRTSISLAEARRLTLTAQGFDKGRPDCSPNRRHIRQVINRLGLLQLDFVNVLVPAHYLVVYSRLGPYDRDRLNQLVYKGRDFIEHWAHEASIVPADSWPLLRYRREEYRPWSNSPMMKIRGRNKYLETAIEKVRSDGPLTAHDLPPIKRPTSKPGDWKKSVARSALEYHFGHGNVSVADRLPNFQRVYDVPEKIIDEPHFSTSMSKTDAQRELLNRAARAFGVATVHDLADYYRMTAKDASPRIAELVDEGKLKPVEVESWKDPAYIHASARLPRSIACSSLLSPFDPVVWFRPRAERLFDFHYRIEIYVPEKKRKWGYYVLPFLLNDRIVGRVDLKADRKSGTLLVLSAHEEPDTDIAEASSALATELRSLANWLHLDKIKVSRRGAFCKALAAECGSSR